MGNNNFHILSIILIFIMMISLMAFYSWFKSSEIKSPIKLNNSRSMRVIFINKKVRLFFTSYFFSCFASAIPATLIIFYVRDYLLAEKFLGLFEKKVSTEISWKSQNPGLFWLRNFCQKFRQHFQNWDLFSLKTPKIRNFDRSIRQRRGCARSEISVWGDPH